MSTGPRPRTVLTVPLGFCVILSGALETGPSALRRYPQNRPLALRYSTQCARTVKLLAVAKSPCIGCAWVVHRLCAGKKAALTFVKACLRDQRAPMARAACFTISVTKNEAGQAEVSQVAPKFSCKSEAYPFAATLQKKLVKHTLKAYPCPGQVAEWLKALPC